MDASRPAPPPSPADRRKVLQKANLPLAVLGPSGLAGEYSYPLWPENIGELAPSAPPALFSTPPTPPIPPAPPAPPDSPSSPEARSGRLTSLFDTLDENAIGGGLPLSDLTLAAIAFAVGFVACGLCVLLLLFLEGGRL